MSLTSTFCPGRIENLNQRDWPAANTWSSTEYFRTAVLPGVTSGSWYAVFQVPLRRLSCGRPATALPRASVFTVTEQVIFPSADVYLTPNVESGAVFRKKYAPSAFAAVVATWVRPDSSVTL